MGRANVEVAMELSSTNGEEGVRRAIGEKGTKELGYTFGHE